MLAKKFNNNIRCIEMLLEETRDELMDSLITT